MGREWKKQVFSATWGPSGVDRAIDFTPLANNFGYCGPRFVAVCDSACIMFFISLSPTCIPTLLCVNGGHANSSTFVPYSKLWFHWRQQRCYVPLSAVLLRTMTKHRSPIAWQQRYVSKFRRECTKRGTSGRHFSRCSWEILGGTKDALSHPSLEVVALLETAAATVPFSESSGTQSNWSNVAIYAAIKIRKHCIPEACESDPNPKINDMMLFLSRKLTVLLSLHSFCQLSSDCSD